MKDIVFPIIEEHQAYINSGENPDEIFRRLLEVCRKINLQLDLITPNSEAEREAIDMAKELFDEGDIENGYNTLKPFFPSPFSVELLAFSLLVASISFALATYVEVRLGWGKLVPLTVHPIMWLVLIFSVLGRIPIKIFLPIASILFAFQLPYLTIQMMRFSWNGLAAITTPIIFFLVILSRPIFQREQREWLWVVLIVLLFVFFGGLICSPVVSFFLYGPQPPYTIPR